MSSDPVLAQQFQIDKTICLGDREKADLSGVTLANGMLASAIAAQNRSNAADAVFTGCMAQKGYMLVAADQVQAQQAQFMAVAAAPTQQTGRGQTPAAH